MQGKTYRFAVLFLFLFSGASGLIYQIVWTKDLTLIMGVTVYAVSTVLSSFMAGLALGSWLFGRLVDRSKNPLLIYALLEGGIGLYAILVPLLFSFITYVYVSLHNPVEGSLTWVVVLRFVLCFVSLLIPTTLMGGTLPVLSKFFVEREKAIGFGVGLLYSLNTLGAVVGCFFTGFFLIPLLGVSFTTYIAVVINLAVATLAMLIARGSGAVTPAKAQAPAPKDGPAACSPGVTRTVFWVIGFAGFISLAYEILWTRVLVYFIGQSTYAFTTMLTTFLVGIALGSLIIARFTDRMKDPVTVLGVVEVLLGLSALMAVLLISSMFDIWDSMKEVLRDYPDWFRGNWWVHMGIRFLLAFIFMFMPTLLMGAAFPIAAKIYSEGLSTLGKRVGNIYSINTLCAIFGSLVTGFILIPTMGLQRSMVFMILMNIALGAVCFLASPRRGFVFKAALLLLTLVAGYGAYTQYEDRAIIYACGLVYGTEDHQTYNVLYCEEGVDASLAVLEGKKNKERQLNINGTSTAYTSITDLQVHRLLAHIPMAIHPDPKRVLVIGFGFGSSSYGTLQYDVERVDCAELVDDEQNTAPFFEAENHGIIENEERFHFFAEDGRNFALTTKTRYDVLSLNAIHPSLGPTLYTHDFYRICRDRLAPGGLACVWLPTTMLTTEEFRILLRSFLDVFPHASFWYNNPGNVILLGAVEPFKIDFKRLSNNLARPSVRADLEPVMLDDPYTFLNLLVFGPARMAAYTEGALLNTDDRPWIEFSRSMYAGFRQDMLEHIFFTEKTDLVSLLSNYGDAEEERREVEHRFSRLRKAWPFMAEGQLITFVPTKEEEQRAAAECLITALRHAPRDKMMLYLARRFAVPGDFHEWRINRLVKDLADKGSASPQESLTLARLHLECGRFREAYDALAGRDQALSGTLDYYLTMALAMEGIGKIDGAKRLLAQAANKWPHKEGPFKQLARLLQIQGDPESLEEALPVAEKAVELNPGPVNLDLLGMIYFELGNLEKAEALVQEALNKGWILHFIYRFHLHQIRGAR